MVDQYAGPFATYTDLTEIVIAVAKTEIRTLFIAYGATMNITFAADMLTYTLVEGSAPSPDFDRITRSMQEQYAVELMAMYAAIEAAPVT